MMNASSCIPEIVKIHFLILLVIVWIFNHIYVNTEKLSLILSFDLSRG